MSGRAGPIFGQKKRPLLGQSLEPRFEIPASKPVNLSQIMRAFQNIFESHKNYPNFSYLSRTLSFLPKEITSTDRKIVPKPAHFRVGHINRL